MGDAHGICQVVLCCLQEFSGIFFEVLLDCFFGGLDCYIVIVGILVNQSVGWDKGVMSSSNIVQISMIHPAFVPAMCTFHRFLPVSFANARLAARKGNNELMPG